METQLQQAGLPSNSFHKDGIYLTNLAEGDIDSLQLQRLFEIASLCPLEGGEAVYQARALLSQSVDTSFIDDILCMTSGKRGYEKPIEKSAEPEKTEEELKINLFPNPALDYAILKLNKELTPLRLRITDAIGREIFDQSIATENGQYRINTAAFASGLYYLGLYSSEGKVYDGKLIITAK